MRYRNKNHKKIAAARQKPAETAAETAAKGEEKTAKTAVQIAAAQNKRQQKSRHKKQGCGKANVCHSPSVSGHFALSNTVTEFCGIFI